MNVVDASGPISFAGHWDSKKLTLDVPELNIQALQYSAQELAGNLPREVERALRESPLRLRIARLLPYVRSSTRSIGGSEPAITTNASDAKEMGEVIAAWICEKLQRTVGEENLRAAEDYLAEKEFLREQSSIWGANKPVNGGFRVTSHAESNEVSKSFSETMQAFQNWLHERGYKEPDEGLLSSSEPDTQPIKELSSGLPINELDILEANRLKHHSDSNVSNPVTDVLRRIAEMLQKLPSLDVGNERELNIWIEEYQALMLEVAALKSSGYKLDPSTINYLNMMTVFSHGDDDTAAIKLATWEFIKDNFLDFETMLALYDLKQGRFYTPAAQALINEFSELAKIIAGDPKIIIEATEAGIKDFVNDLNSGDTYKKATAIITLLTIVLPFGKGGKAKKVFKAAKNKALANARARELTKARARALANARRKSQRNKKKNSRKPPQVKVNRKLFMDFDNSVIHMIKVEGLSGNKGISGGHDARAFYSFINSNHRSNSPVRVIIVKDPPFINGFKVVEYNTSQRAAANKPPLRKTLYDPALYSERQIAQIAAEAAEKGVARFAKAQQPLVSFDETSRGVRFMFYVDDSLQRIRNFHPII